MNQNLQRLSVQITKHQYNLLKHHTKPGTSISSLVRDALDDFFSEADQTLGEQAIENVKYEEYEKYMAAQKAAGIKEPAIADVSSIF